MIKTELTIVSLDPGGTTGVAVCRIPKSGSYANGFTGLELGPEPHFKDLWAFLTNSDPDIVIYEDFVHQDNEAVKLISLQYIGVARLYSELTKKPVYSRPRSNKDVAWLKGASLKKLGLYTADKPHRNDATRHLVHYVVNDLRRKEILERLRKKGWSGITPRNMK